jgi:pyruvate,orthophosphate dikinase
LRASNDQLLGGKGALEPRRDAARLKGAAEMPVPPGFTISTEVCTHFSHGRRVPVWLWSEVDPALARVEELMGAKRFGDAKNPLLVSVRSGARVSMPGMMDTVLNLGLNDTTVVDGLAKLTQSDPRFAWDAYRRFLQMYANVVLMGAPRAQPVRARARRAQARARRHARHRSRPPRR